MESAKSVPLRRSLGPRSTSGGQVAGEGKRQGGEGRGEGKKGEEKRGEEKRGVERGGGQRRKEGERREDRRGEVKRGEKGGGERRREEELLQGWTRNRILRSPGCRMMPTCLRGPGVAGGGRERPSPLLPSLHLTDDPAPKLSHT